MRLPAGFLKRPTFSTADMMIWIAIIGMFTGCFGLGIRDLYRITKQAELSMRDAAIGINRMGRPQIASTRPIRLRSAPSQ